MIELVSRKDARQWNIERSRGDNPYVGEDTIGNMCADNCRLHWCQRTVGKRSQGLGNYQKLLRRRSHNLLHLKGLSNLSEGEYSAFQFAFTFHGGLVKLTRSGAVRMRCPEIGHPCLRMPYCYKIQPQLYFRKGIPRVCGSERRSPSGAMSYIYTEK